MSASQVLLCLPRFSTNKPNRPHCGKTLVKELAVTQPNIFCALSTALFFREEFKYETKQMLTWLQKCLCAVPFQNKPRCTDAFQFGLWKQVMTLQVYILCTMEKKKKKRYAWLITWRSDHETLKTSTTVVQESFSREHKWHHKIILTCNTQKFKTSPH